MNKKILFATFFVVKKLCLFIFFLQTMAYADNPTTTDQARLNIQKISLQFESKILVASDKKSVASNPNSLKSTKKDRLKLLLSKKLERIKLGVDNDIFVDQNINEDLKIASRVQPKIAREDWLIDDDLNDASKNDEEYMEPYAGDFIPNTEEENNIILASMLIIFTGAVIIAIISYL